MLYPRTYRVEGARLPSRYRPAPHAGYAGILELRGRSAMTIVAKYENGIFRPLENVTLKEGTIVEVRLPTEGEQPRTRPFHQRSSLLWHVG